MTTRDSGKPEHPDRRTYAFRLPYDRAAALAGGEDKLATDPDTGRSLKPARISNYRRFGVPAAAVLPHLIQRLEDGDLSRAWQRALPPQAARVIAQIRKLYEQTGGQTSQWLALEALLRLAVPDAFDKPANQQNNK